MSPETITVLRSEVNEKGITDEQQAELNRRRENDEPLYDEDREGYVPPEDPAAKAKALGLPEDASEEEIQTKEQELADQRKEKAKGLGLPEDASDEDIKKKEKETAKSGEEGNDQKAFDEADEQRKRDMIIEKELEAEKEADEEKKKEIEETIKSWKEVVEKDTGRPLSDDKTLEEQIKSYSEKKNVSMEEAKEEIESRQAIAKKYGDNNLELAGAYKAMQVELTKERAERIKAEKSFEVNALHMRVDPRQIEPEKLLQKKDGSFYTREEILDMVRAKHPKKTEEMSDDAIYELAQDEYALVLESKRRTKLAEMEGEAKGRRAELIANIPKEGEPYKEEIQKQLNEFPNGRVLDKDFNLQDLIYWAKGKDTDRLVKEADARGYRRGVENRRIAGMSQKAKPGSHTNKQPDATNDFGLDAEEKKTAEQRFSGDDISLERKYQLYAYSIGKIASRD